MRPPLLAAAAVSMSAALAAPLSAGEVTAQPTAVYELFTLDGGAGVRVTVTNYGARILSIECPDRDGRVVNVALGHGPELADWVEAVESGVNPYFGAVVGRYGNRIACGQFTLDGETYTLVTNNGPNHLHGGTVGFDRVRWAATPYPLVPDGSGGTVQISDPNAVTLRHVSPDGAEGYPGVLTATVTYQLRGDTLAVYYAATTTAPTPVNLTQHTYFNLKGEGAGDVLGHELTLNADRFTPIDDTLIPTGELRPVTGTPFDFTAGKPIGRDVDAKDEQLEIGGGYDHNFVLTGGDADRGGLSPAARVVEPLTGRVLEVSTDQPGVQFYTGNFLDGSIIGTSGRPYVKRGAFCLETQHFPDGPNQPDFPSTILRPGETYRTKTAFRFTTDASATDAAGGAGTP